MLLTILPVGKANNKIVDHTRKVLAETIPDFSFTISKQIFPVPQDAIIQKRRQ
jgi:hypothetical protein